MNKGTSFALVGIALVGGFALGRVTTHGSGGGGSDSAGEAAADKAVAPAPADGVNRVKVPAGGPMRGPADAPVTIVVFSDFQCPFCSRVVPTLERIDREYPGKVRTFFRHNPLPFHPNAMPSAQAAVAAAAQGKFWQMHDKLFANQQNQQRADFEKYAQDIGLDMGKFKAALDSGAGKAVIDADMELGRKLGVQGTPNSFVNGRAIEGAVPYEQFKTVIDDELARAAKLTSSGTPAGQVYARLMAGARDPGTPAPAAPGAAPTPPTPARPNVGAEVYKIALGDAPTRGGKHPKVTIVEFSDFQCPFCSRVVPTLDQLQKTYGDDVSLTFKHLPLPFHPNAMPDALAAVAAQEQGKFWEMHDKLFANQAAQTPADLEKYAQEIGLNLAKYKAAIANDKNKKKIEADSKEAENFGARGTPNFFINGRNFRGAQPLEAFKTVIDEELKKADDKLKAGVPRAKLYAEITKDGLDKAAAPAPAAAKPSEPGAGQVMKAEVGNAPIRGAKDALVTIVEYSDFQCPFCGRVEDTLAKVLKDYDGKVRIAWKDTPLPFHPNAGPAANAAREARAAGKFWEMHDALFKNQQNLDRPTLEKLGAEVGINAGKLKTALDTNKYQKDIEADTQAGAKIGVRGTPAFFINGTFLSGAQPYDAFKARIDDELKKAEELVKKGTSKAKVYDAIMKTAKADLPAAPAAAAGAEPAGPENDKTVFKVDAGRAPSRGPKNAPITAVIYSDFQCPFCSRVEPTITELEKAYPGKIRVVWKNFPLEFHQNAKPAAMAAMAANEQGKFWEMHDTLFKNQQNLDRPSLEKYAQEIGLDVGKFKAALDSNKYAGSIESDMKEGQALGVNGTPATFINGRKIGGAYPIDTFKKVVDQELAKPRKGT